MNRFNIRVYGILVNGENEVLISDERERGREFTKFPGGGLEYGEGLVDGLIREFMEECAVKIDVLEHIHTTDIFLKSAFDSSQVIGVYYRVREMGTIKGRFSEKRLDFEQGKELDQVFRWVKMNKLVEEELTFEMDRMAWKAFMSEKRYGF